MGSVENSSRDNIMNDIISKIILYSSEANSNPVKLLKYLLLIRKQRSPNKFTFIETKLRKAGVIKHLILYFNRRADKCNLENNKQKQNPQISSASAVSKTMDTTLEITTNGLSILANAFLVDQESRKEAEKYKFIMSLKTFLESKEFPLFTTDVLVRIIKCVANLGVSDKTRAAILQHGVGILIINKLDEIYNKLTENVKALSVAHVEEVIIEKKEELILNEAIRAIRIFCSNVEFQQHLIRFGAFLSVGRFLRFSYNQTLFSEILRALAILSINVKGLSRKAVEDLTDQEGCDRDILIKIIGFLKTHHTVSKVVEPTILCLTNLANNITMAKALIEFEVFETALQATKLTEDTSRLEKFLRLFVLLTKDSSASNGYLRLACCTQLGETLKILTNTKLQDYHHWIICLYEHLYEEKLKDLVSRGILRILDSYVRQEWGEFSMESLRLKISTLDEDTCFVHSRNDNKCPFYPKYSCSSPSYKQFEEEAELMNSSSNDSTELRVVPTVMSSKAFSSFDRSPPSSPCSVVYPFSPAYSSPSFSSAPSPSQSPQYGFSPSSPGCSDDEGIYSSSSRSPPSEDIDPANDANEYSEAESDRESQNDIKVNDPAVKYARKSKSSSDREPPVKKLKFDFDNGDRKDSNADKVGVTSVNVEPKSDGNRTNLSSIHRRSNKISSVLGILNKCSHFPVLPSELTVFLPFLLEMIWSGRLSVEKRNQFTNEQSTEDLVQLRRICFQRAFKIVFRICSDINVFPKLVQENVIPCMYRILVYGLRVRGDEEETQKVKIRQFMNDYTSKIMDALIGMLDSKNATCGWRQGYFQSIFCVGEGDKDYTNVSLSIPLLYRQQCPIYRDFEEKTRNWENIFQMLIHVDELPFTEFQNCILALTCICKTKGLKWLDAEKASKRKLLFSSEELSLESLKQDSEDNFDSTTISFELEDGYDLTMTKRYLTESSPVFSAMFDGHFLETTTQHVYLKDINRATLIAFASQIYQQLDFTQEKSSESTYTYVSNHLVHELLTLFQLLSLTDQFLLHDLYERTLNTLVSYYICPYSAPTIYKEFLKYQGSPKADKKLGFGFDLAHLDLDLSKLALKYLLVGEDISFTLRSGAFWKIFDAVNPTVVVQGIKDILYPAMNKY